MAKTEQKLHIALIPDGNRRWAKKQMLQPWKGHEQSAQNFRNLVEWCGQDGRVSVLTIWCFSTENWKRDPDEVSHLMKIFSDYLQKERAELKAKRIRIAHSGRTDRIDPAFRTLLEDIGNDTPTDATYTLHLAIDYGGKDEIVRAVGRMGAEPVTEESIRAHVDHPELPDIDLIIRTSGEQRTSNFFLWQSTYAEWMFVDKHFPDFAPADLEKAIDAFTKRHRRFGA